MQSNIVEPLMHDADPFTGRRYRNRVNGDIVQMRPLTKYDLYHITTGQTGQPGRDYFITYNRSTIGVISPEEFADYEQLPREQYVLDAIRFYDWLKIQGIPLIGNFESVLNDQVEGVSVGANRKEFGQPSVVFIHPRGVNEKALGEMVVKKLHAIGIITELKFSPDGYSIEFLIEELAKLPS